MIATADNSARQLPRSVLQGIPAPNRETRWVAAAPRANAELAARGAASGQSARLVRICALEGEMSGRAERGAAA